MLRRWVIFLFEMPKTHDLILFSLCLNKNHTISASQHIDIAGIAQVFVLSNQE